MNAPFRQPTILPPIPPLILAEAALNAWARDRHSYKAGCCDDPAPYPCCQHLFEGDAAPVQAVRITAASGEVAFVRMTEVAAARAARSTVSSPTKGEPAP